MSASGLSNRQTANALGLATLADIGNVANQLVYQAAGATTPLAPDGGVVYYDCSTLLSNFNPITFTTQDGRTGQAFGAYINVSVALEAVGFAADTKASGAVVVELSSTLNRDNNYNTILSFEIPAELGYFQTKGATGVQFNGYFPFVVSADPEPTTLYAFMNWSPITFVGGEAGTSVNGNISFLGTSYIGNAVQKPDFLPQVVPAPP
jgi:hypothetical protein